MKIWWYAMPHLMKFEMVNVITWVYIMAVSWICVATSLSFNLYTQKRPLGNGQTEIKVKLHLSVFGQYERDKNEESNHMIHITPDFVWILGNLLWCVVNTLPCFKLMSVGYLNKGSSVWCCCLQWQQHQQDWVWEAWEIRGSREIK